MPNVYWQEFKRWIKAFTGTEILLALIEGVLLIGCIAFFAFLILHFIVCPPNLDKYQPEHKPSVSTSAAEDVDNTNRTTVPPRTSSGAAPPSTPHTSPGTFPPDVKCTWEQSKTTKVLSHYYENDKTTAKRPTITTKGKMVEDVDSLAQDDQSDGEESRDVLRSGVLALVRDTRDNDETFGCTLTAVTEHWALTAASCLEAVEEVDSLDNFVMMERYGEAARGRTHAVADVRPHPQYGGRDTRFDLAALRGDAPFRAVNTPRLPDLLDYFLVTMGERLSLFGFGAFRTVESKSYDRRVREVQVYALPAAACAAGAGAGAEGEAAWAPRHLSRGQPLQHGGCGAAALCAGPLYARGAACRYCAGSPLLRAGTLLGVMSDARRCGVACEPASYVNIVLVRDWIDTVIADE